MYMNLETLYAVAYMSQYNKLTGPQRQHPEQSDLVKQSSVFAEQVVKEYTALHRPDVKYLDDLSSFVEVLDKDYSDEKNRS